MTLSEPSSAPALAAASPVADIDPLEDPRWDAFVERHPDGIVYQHSSWLRTLAAEYGRRPLGIAAVNEDGSLRGVLALLATRGLPLLGGAVAGRRLASLPRTPVSGPLTFDDDAAGALLRAAISRSGATGAQLQIKASALPGGVPVDGLAAHPWRLTYVLELPDDAGAVRFGNSRNHSRIRWAVNKATKAGVTVRAAEDLADVRAWYRLYLETMRRHVVPPRPRRLFEAMWKHMRPQGTMRLLLAERHGQVLAGSVLLRLNATVFYAFNGVDHRALADRPNDVLQWEAIHAAAAEGARRYDFGEVVERHDGLADFKRKWGAEPHRLHRLYFPAPAGAPDPGDGDDRALVRIGHRAWRRLPLPLTAAAGDLAFRYL